MPLVIDASVAFKWFVPEIDDDKALALLDLAEPLWAPDLVLAEVGNGLLGRLRKLPTGQQATRQAVRNLSGLYARLLPARDFVDRALGIAFELTHPIYDCVYLALCVEHKLQLVTADEKFHRVVCGTPYEPHVQLLGNFAA